MITRLSITAQAKLNESAKQFFSIRKSDKRGAKDHSVEWLVQCLSEVFPMIDWNREDVNIMRLVNIMESINNSSPEQWDKQVVVMCSFVSNAIIDPNGQYEPIPE